MHVTSGKIEAKALQELGHLHRHGRNPVAELAYYRIATRRKLEGKENRMRLR